MPPNFSFAGTRGRTYFESEERRRRGAGSRAKKFNSVATVRIADGIGRSRMESDGVGWSHLVSEINRSNFAGTCAQSSGGGGG